MEDFLKHLNKLSTLNKEEIVLLTNIVEEKKYLRGEEVLKMHQINKKLYFVNDGLVKISFFNEDKEFVMNFFDKHHFCAVLDSLLTKQPSQYKIIAIQNTSLIEIDYYQLEKLAAEHLSFEKITSSLLSIATGKMMSRVRELLESDASERYSNFLKNKSHLINQVSLKDLSAYFGISQVSLSRIRAKK
ncbi:Crp/Fnr family transcriptional regulator [uncultured Kordia sp.]|uniref:Crp/Fnr family transcriptional regulator n=1 Tax=uncultured Kordia sp. TaxID=507699 RepID=UPI002635E7EC|nr:Crp/Fnr family transcriptional regulator [uncultured Kordia sp.]